MQISFMPVNSDNYCQLVIHHVNILSTHIVTNWPVRVLRTTYWNSINRDLKLCTNLAMSSKKCKIDLFAN